MAWSLTDWFPQWGASGVQPSSGKNYAGQEQVAYQHFNYLWDALDDMETEVQNAFDDIDSDGDGVVDEADNTTKYKGFDLDGDFDGVVNKADSTNRVKGSDLDTQYGVCEQSLDVGVNRFAYMYVTSIEDGETLDVSTATILSEDGTAAPTGLSIRFYELGAGIDRGSILDSDGTLLVEQNVNATYTNTSGSTEDMAILIDNGLYGTGTGSKEDVLASFRVRHT